MKVSLIVFTIDEIEGMRAIMPRVKREWVDQIILFDGGSTDGTIEYAEEHGYLVHKETGGGVRPAYKELMPKIEGDVIIAFSPDGNSVPELIPDLAAKMKEGYDMVIASRYLGPARSEDDTAITAFGNWLFTRTVRLLHGSKITDVMVMYRAFRKQLLYDLELLEPKWYATPEKLLRCRIGIEPLMSVRAAKRKLKIAEIPGDEPARIGGKTKLKVWRWGAAYYFQILREVFFWR